MSSYGFNPAAKLLIFECRVEYERALFVSMALDTAATMTMISESVLNAIGLKATKQTGLASFGDASQIHPVVPVFVLKTFGFNGARVKNLPVLRHSFDPRYGIDGLIGLNFLRHFKTTIDFDKNLVRLTRRKFT